MFPTAVATILDFALLAIRTKSSIHIDAGIPKIEAFAG
jgi:hypothetical protein